MSFRKWAPGGSYHVYQERDLCDYLTGEQPAAQNRKSSQLDLAVPTRTVPAKAVLSPEFFLVVVQV